MSEAYAYMHANKGRTLPTMDELSGPVSSKNKTDAALSALGLSETTTAIPRSMIVELVDAEDNFLYHKIVQRVETLVSKALALQTDIAKIEAELAGRSVDIKLFMTDTDLQDEPWDYVEWVTYEYPSTFDEDRDWRELVLLVEAEKRLSDDTRRQEIRLEELKSLLERVSISHQISELIIREQLTDDTQEGVA